MTYFVLFLWTSFYLFVFMFSDFIGTQGLYLRTGEAGATFKQKATVGNRKQLQRRICVSSRTQPALLLLLLLLLLLPGEECLLQRDSCDGKRSGEREGAAKCYASPVCAAVSCFEWDICLYSPSHSKCLWTGRSRRSLATARRQSYSIATGHLYVSFATHLLIPFVLNHQIASQRIPQILESHPTVA